MTDEAAVRQLIEQYAARADRADGESAAALFDENAELVLYLDPTSAEPTSRRRGRAEIRTAIERLGTYRATYHSIGSSVVDIEGDHARGDTRCDAHHLVDDSDACRDHTMYLRYLDDFVRTGDGWRFARRELRVIWTAVNSVESARPAP